MAKNIGRTLIPNSDGIVFNFVAGAAVSAGDLVPVGDTVGVATKDVANGAEGWLKRGVMVKAVTKLTADVVSVGDTLYWDSGNSRLTLTSTSNTRAGLAANAADGSTSTVNVNLI
mgnify:CR=1 FL=1